jgi:hypothetical protein
MEAELLYFISQGDFESPIKLAVEDFSDKIKDIRDQCVTEGNLGYYLVCENYLTTATKKEPKKLKRRSDIKKIYNLCLEKHDLHWSKKCLEELDQKEEIPWIKKLRSLTFHMEQGNLIQAEAWTREMGNENLHQDQLRKILAAQIDQARLEDAKISAKRMNIELGKEFLEKILGTAICLGLLYTAERAARELGGELSKNEITEIMNFHTRNGNHNEAKACADKIDSNQEERD